MQLNDIKKVACVGAGLIGSSWATMFSRNGYDVNIYDVAPESLATVLERIGANLGVFVDGGYMTEEAKQQALARITVCPDLNEALKDVQFIQECVPEKLDLKQEMVAKMDAANSTAIICSSTSGMHITDIAAKSQYPNRYIGGHPFNPPHLMPLVELTKGERTDPDLVIVARDFYRKNKKEPVILKKESEGFIGNRLQGAYIKEAVEIIMDDVCSIEDLDKVSVFALGIRWAILGPHLNGELNGGDGGVKAYFGEKYKPGTDRAFKRILSSKITELPVEYGQKIAPEGVAEELKNRKPGTGNTTPEVVKYRDQFLLKILDAHDML